jgi:thioredoxin-related protein
MERSGKLVWALCALLLAAGPALALTWETDYEKARAAAKEQDKALLLNFSGSDWCGFCIKLEKEVFSKPEFEKWAQENVVPVLVDSPRRKGQSAELRKQATALKRKFGVRGFPTVVLVDAEGKELGRVRGYRPGGPEAYIKQVEQQMADKPAKGEAAADAGGEDQDLKWLTDYEKAQATAEEKGRYVLLDFSGSDWCGWCVRLDKEVFSKPAFAAFAEKNLVPVLLDFPKRKRQSAEQKKQNVTLLRKYGVRGFPTIILLSPKGEFVAQTGYRPGGAERYVAHLAELIEAYEKKAGAEGGKPKNEPI